MRRCGEPCQLAAHCGCSEAKPVLPSIRPTVVPKPVPSDFSPSPAMQTMRSAQNRLCLTQLCQNMRKSKQINKSAELSFLPLKTTDFASLPRAILLMAFFFIALPKDAKYRDGDQTSSRDIRAYSPTMAEANLLVIGRLRFKVSDTVRTPNISSFGFSDIINHRVGLHRLGLHGLGLHGALRCLLQRGWMGGISKRLGSPVL